MAYGNRWLVYNYLQTWLDGTVVITFDTDITVHAWLCHSLTPPNMHLQALDRRGLRMMKDPYFCFLKQDCFEQDEPGDTIHHTFTWPGWYHCLTQWFFFKATKGGVKTPTQWGIFHKHYIAPQIYTLLITANGDQVNIWFPEDTSVHWLMCRDQDTTYVPPDPGHFYGQMLGNYVWMRQYDGYQWRGDLFTFQPLPGPAPDILELKIVMRVGRLYVYGKCKSWLKTHGTLYEGPELTIPAPGLFELTQAYAVNPFTGSAWTPGEVAGIQAGLWLAHAGTYGMAVCDQVRVEVKYRPPE